jgi:hypothetical protein
MGAAGDEKRSVVTEEWEQERKGVVAVVYGRRRR